MTGKKMNENSLANLRLGSVARSQDKIRCTFTITPTTKEWLAKSGNASGRIDDMVRKWLKGELVGKGELDRANERIALLEEELREIKNKG